MQNICKVCNKITSETHFRKEIQKCKRCFLSELRQKQIEVQIKCKKKISQHAYNQIFIHAKNILSAYRDKNKMDLLCSINDLNKYFKETIEIKEEVKKKMSL
jgi:uncharacterized protein (UPF0332 family)